MFIPNPAFLILSSHLHSILNKLTPDNFSRLSQELVYLASASNDREKLKGAILLVCNTHVHVHVCVYKHNLSQLSNIPAVPPTCTPTIILVWSHHEVVYILCVL